MKKFAMRHIRIQRKGAALLLALIFIAMMAAMSIALSQTVRIDLQLTSNSAEIQQAQMAAESGLAAMTYQLSDIQLPASTNPSNMMDRMSAAVSDILNETANLNGQSVTVSGNTIHVPPIQLTHGSFTTDFVLVENSANSTRWMLVVTGNFGGAEQNVSVTFKTVPQLSSVFDYGIASQGKIYVSGSALIEGINENSEADTLSTTDEPVAIEAGGHATIDGDLYVTHEEGIYLKGNGLTIGGTSNIADIIKYHLHFDTIKPDFPEVDVAPFEAMTTSVIDSTTDMSGSGGVFNNVRIAAGTNPDFRNDTVINGVLYIESPNYVTFHSSVTINGIIVTEDATGEDISQNQIDFRGHSSVPGVDALPDTPEFADVKDQQGTALLAPGFAVTFRGSSNIINGTIAADQFSFRGTTDVDGDLQGSILGLGTYDMTLSGNATIRFNRQDSEITPAGFIMPIGLEAMPSTYTEN